MFAGYESGLLQALDQAPSTKEALAEKLGAQRLELLEALLDVGLAAKELELKEGQYSLKGKRSRAVVNPKGGMVAAMIQANVGYYCDAYRHFTDRLNGGELGDDLEEIGDVVARFSKGIEPIVRDFVKAIASGKQSMRVLDVGCGTAFFLQSVHSVNPKATGVGLDIDPTVAKLAGDNIAAWGLSERFTIVQGDIRHPPEEAAGPFDLINMSSMLYYFGPRRAGRALLERHARQAGALGHAVGGDELRTARAGTWPRPT